MKTQNKKQSSTSVEDFIVLIQEFFNITDQLAKITELYTEEFGVALKSTTSDGTPLKVLNLKGRPTLLQFSSKLDCWVNIDIIDKIDFNLNIPVKEALEADLSLYATKGLLQGDWQKMWEIPDFQEFKKKLEANEAKMHALVVALTPEETILLQQSQQWQEFEERSKDV